MTRGIFRQSNAATFLYLLIALFGFTATSAQILFLRVFLATYSGNEISIGIFLAAWLLWTAAGSYFSGKIVEGFKEQWLLILILQTLTAFAVPATLLAIRFSRVLIYPLPGEVAAPEVNALVSFILLAPFGLFSGGLFAAGSRLMQKKKALGAAQSTGHVYMTETAGAALGGLVFSLILLQLLGNFLIALLLLLLNAVFILYAALRVFKWAARFLWLFALFIFLYAFALNKANQRLLEAEWPGFQFLEQRDTPYGRLTVIRQQENITLLENGIPLITLPDPQTAEETAHYGLLLHEQPEKILLIGGGFSPLLSELLKHPSVERITVVENEAQRIELSRKYFSHILPQNNRHKPVKSVVTDGRLFLAKNEEKYDLIILNLPDPYTAQINRFYTREFFMQVRRRMLPGGLFTFRLSAAENYINLPLARYLNCIYTTLSTVFDEVEMMPGEMLHFFAAKGDQKIELVPEALIQRLRERQLDTRYVREYFIPFKISALRRDALHKALNRVGESKINSDFTPAAYYLTSVFWSGKFAGIFSGILNKMYSAPRSLLLIVPFVGILIILLRRLKKNTRQAEGRFLAMATVLTCGFSMISLELVILLTFQALHGALYQHLAVLIGLFMAGMFAGTLLGLRLPLKNNGRMLTAVNLILVLSVAVMALFIHLVSGDCSISSQLWLNLLMFIVGMSGGLTFPVVSAAFYGGDKRQNIGAVYALDLVGSLVGAFFTAIAIIPLFGFQGILTLIAGLHLVLAMAASLSVRFDSVVEP